MERTARLLFSILLFFASNYDSGAFASEETKKTPDTISMTDSWWQKTSEDVIAREYHISRTTHSERNNDPIYQAPNRAHNYRTYFTSEGVTLVPRQSQSNDWSWGMQLVSAGKRDDLRPLILPNLEVDQNRISYHRDNITEWYVNRESGIEQGFTLHEEVSDEPLTVIRLKLTGNLIANLNNNSLELTNQHGVRILEHSKLLAFDAHGKKLDSHFALNDKTLDIVINTEHAAYPIVIDPLTTAAVWSTESQQIGGWAGWSVASAGDVNNDGYDDVIIGIPNYDSGEPDEGIVNIYYGSSMGFSTTPDWSKEGNQSNAAFGSSVATAGDVNDDGYDDIIIGSWGYDNGETDEGRVFVYHGGDPHPSMTADWFMESNQAHAWYGWSVSSAGDVNSDGFDDVLVGAPYFDNGHTDEGMAFVYLGGTNGLAISPAWTAESDQDDAYLGYSVAAAGYINQDVYADIIVAAYGFDNGEIDEGMVWVYRGSDLGVESNPTWSAESDQDGARFGWSIAGAGDVNLDGYSDVIIGSHLYDNGETNEGRVFVYHGSSLGLSLNPDWSSESNQVDAAFGFSVSSAGDVDNDGYDDILIGAPYYDNGEVDEGMAFFYFGDASGLLPNPSWVSESDQAGALLGLSLASAGDTYLDNFDDMLIAAPFYTNGETSEGRVYLYEGKNDFIDSDGDGEPDAIDLYPLVPNDSDADGVPDSLDNCIDVANAVQGDADSDGHGNACDGDYDNTCSVNFADLVIFKAGFGTVNPELDHDDSGGNINFTDLSIFKLQLFFTTPGPSAPPHLCN